VECEAIRGHVDIGLDIRTLHRSRSLIAIEHCDAWPRHRHNWEISRTTRSSIATSFPCVEKTLFGGRAG